MTDIFLGQSTDSLEKDKSPFRDAMETLLRVNTLRLPFGYLYSIPIIIQHILTFLAEKLQGCFQIGC